MTHFDFFLDIQFWIDLLEFLLIPVLMFYDYFCSFYRLFVPVKLKSLKQDIILVTGSASGIGKEVCYQLLATGVKSLVLWDIDAKNNETLTQSLRFIARDMAKEGGPITSIHCYKVDVSDKEKVCETAEKVRRDVGTVTIVFNNAGTATISDFFEARSDQLENTIKVNLLGQFWVLREFLPAMISKGRGHVVTNCSMLGLIGVTKGVAYCGSKFGVRGYLEALESEVRHMPSKPDIKFTTVYPFFVDTPMVDNLNVEYRLSFLFKHLDCRSVSEIIVKAIRKESHSVNIPWHLSFLIALQQIVPQTSINRVMDFFIKDIKYEKKQPILDAEVEAISKKITEKSDTISFQKTLNSETRMSLKAVTI